MSRALVCPTIFFAMIFSFDRLSTANARELPQIHPKVFSMVQSWLSDVEEPIVTEINLDAVFKDSNQFDSSQVKQTDGWVKCLTEDGKGFMQYKVLRTNGDHYSVRFEENGGGSLTTSATIDFCLDVRQINRGGKQASIHILRVDGISNN